MTPTHEGSLRQVAGSIESERSGGCGRCLDHSRQRRCQSVMGTTVQEQRDKANKGEPLWGVGANYPMYYVSWQEVQAFMKKLKFISRAPNKKTQ